VPLATAEARYVVALGAGYWASMIIARTVIGFYPLDSRLMMPAYPLVAVGVVAAGVTFVERLWPAAARHLVAGTAAAAVVLVAALLLPRSLTAGGPRLALPPAPPWVAWVAANTPPDALIVGNVAFDHNLYSRRPVLAFSSNRYGISHFDCQSLSDMLGKLHLRAYLVLRTERGQFSAEHLGSLYGSAIEAVLNGGSPLPLRLLARHEQYAVFEVLDTRWECGGG